MRTTITIPEELYMKTRLEAARKGKSVSGLITQTLSIHINGVKKQKKGNPVSVLGSLKLGGKEPYKHRSELYEEHLKRKIGY